ncbi:MAG: ABC transporter ATP-binding protein [Phycisphaeraceae bacterium]
MQPITLRQLTKHFGATRAVDGVDLDIQPGELFFLLGPSGCGKTTLLRMLAGFTEPTAGSIHFGKQDVTHLPPNKRNTGMVFQGYALWPHMTVRQNVAFGLDVRKIPSVEKQKRVDQVLRTVQMHAYADRKPNQLSGGQQQRVALARALVVQPTVLLLDEPLSNLDAKLRTQMRSEIRRICKDAGITAVYVTHDQKEALSMSDRIAVMHEGHVMQVGPPRTLYERPTSRFVADFLGETNFLAAEVVGREGQFAVLETAAGRLHSCAYAADLPATGNVTCSIRPEALRLGVNGQAGEQRNTFTATRAQAVYFGEIAQHHLQVGDQLRLIAFELNPAVTDAAGADVRVHIAPEDVVILGD